MLIGTNQNLDFIKINNHRNIMEFLDTNLGSNLNPTIRQPTQIIKNSDTLIDNIDFNPLRKPS